MLDEILNHIYTKNPRQKKKLQKLLSTHDGQEIFLSLRNFLKNYQNFIHQKKITPFELADAYLRLVDNMSYSRLEFQRTGKYSCKTQTEAIQKVYNNDHIMAPYMLGLALSQFLWIQHYKLFCFYKTHIASMNFNELTTFLEVGSGHGLFLIELLKRKTTKSSIDVVDISPVSLKISQEIVEAILPQTLSSIHFIHQDITTYHSSRLYDFITMGEVLEHLEKPQELLKSLSRQLKPNGTAFISTCANAPAVDHIYHFETIDEIRMMITDNGFHIVKEIVAPSEKVSPIDIEKYKIDILYGSVVTLEGKRESNGCQR